MVVGVGDKQAEAFKLLLSVHGDFVCSEAGVPRWACCLLFSRCALAWEFQRKGVGRQVSGLTTRDQATIFSTQLKRRTNERKGGTWSVDSGDSDVDCVRLFETAADRGSGCW